MNKQKMLDMVVSVCNEVPEAKNDDALLVSEVWRRLGWDNSQSLYANMKRLPRGESITRRRRQAHLMGLITYSDEADAVRFEAYERERYETRLY